MGDSFDCILDRMCKIIHRIDAPLVTRIMVCHMCHTIQDRITHIDIRGCHIDMGTQYLCAILVHAVFHIFKQLQIFFNASVTVWIFLTRLCQCSSVGADLICAQIGYICFALFDQFYRAFIHLIKIIGCKEETIFPVSPKPFDISLDGLYEF